jgi:hypothetical protein
MSELCCGRCGSTVYYSKILERITCPICDRQEVLLAMKKRQGKPEGAE